MRVRSKEEMTLYRRELRARKKLVTPGMESVTPHPERVKVVTPDSVTPLKSVTPASGFVTPQIVTPCAGCLDRDLQIKKLTVRVAFLEKSMERYAVSEKSVRSPYKLGPEWQRV